jgi:hypothetical protein
MGQFYLKFEFVNALALKVVALVSVYNFKNHFFSHMRDENLAIKTLILLENVLGSNPLERKIGRELVFFLLFLKTKPII